MFQKLPEKVLEITLYLFNKFWEEGKMPKNLHHIKVVSEKDVLQWMLL